MVKENKSLKEQCAELKQSLKKAMPFAEVATISNDPEGPLPGLSSGAWLHELSDAAVEVLIQFGQPDMGSSPLTVTEIRHAGGAVKRGGETASAYGNREAEHIMQLIGVTPTPEINQALRQYVSNFLQELNPHLTGGVYLNFLEGAEARERTRAGFSPQAFQRLQSLKSQVDPDNRFSHSFDIQPE